MHQSLEVVGTQVAGCVDGLIADLFQHIVDGQDHEGQEVVDHAQDDGGRRVDDGDVRQMKSREHAVDDAVLLQKRLPGEGAEQEVHPHGKDEDKDHEAAAGDAPLAENHGQRVGDHQADHGADEGKPQR